MAKMIKTRFAGVYKNKTTGLFYYLTKVRLADGSYKSIRSKAKYDTAIECYTEMVKTKEEGGYIKPEERIFKEPIPIDTQTKKAPQMCLKSFSDVAIQFLELYKTKVKYQTYYQREKLIKNQIIPIFIERSINFICETKTIAEFKSYLAELEISNIRRNQMIFVIKEIVEFAYYSNYITQQEYGLVKINLTQFKEISQVATPKRAKREKFFYTIDEFNYFVRMIEHEKELTMLLYMLFYGGFRLGEALALTPNDVDFDLGFVKVYKSKESCTNQITTTKTSNSIRRVYLPKKVLAMLKSYCEELSLDAPIFTTSRTMIARKLKDYSQFVGVEHLNPHGYRHSCCSYLFQKYKEKNIAIDFKQVADHLGDNVNTVLDVYYHLYGSEKSKIVNLLDD